MSSVVTRMGDGSTVRTTRDEVGRDIVEGSEAAAAKREELDIGVVTAVPGLAKGLEAKARIADLLGIRINSVERLKAKTGLGTPVA